MNNFFHSEYCQCDLYTFDISTFFIFIDLPQKFPSLSKENAEEAGRKKWRKTNSSKCIEYPTRYTGWIISERSKRTINRPSGGRAPRYALARIAICMEIWASLEFRRHSDPLVAAECISCIVSRLPRYHAETSSFHPRNQYTGYDECLPVPARLYSSCKWPFSRGTTSIPNVFTPVFRGYTRGNASTAPGPSSRPVAGLLQVENVQIGGGLRVLAGTLRLCFGVYGFALTR